MAVKPCAFGYILKDTAARGSQFALFGNAMRRSRFRKQQSLVVARAMEDMHHFDGAGAHSVENQVIAERTSADTEMFVARHQRITARRIRQRLTFFPQLLHEIKCDFDTLLSYVGCSPRSASAVTTTITVELPWP